MRKLAKQSFAAAAMALSISTIAVADNDDSRGGKGRSVATLDGKFIFAASGHIIPAAGPAQPKAIVEWIRFNGDGTLSVAGATRSLNGVIAQIGRKSTSGYHERSGTSDPLLEVSCSCNGREPRHLDSKNAFDVLGTWHEVRRTTHFVRIMLATGSVGAQADS